MEARSTTTRARTATSLRREPNTFRPEGEYWTIVFESEVTRLRDSSGLHYLVRLLRSPDVELHCMELSTAWRRPRHDPDDERCALVSGDAGEMLDVTARRAYRARLTDIDAELARAETTHDLGTETHLRRERAFLADELAAAVGLGGRGRRTGSIAERARLNVSRAIRTTITRITAHHPLLGDHLARTIRTGGYCTYRPDPRAPGWLFERDAQAQ